MKDREEPLITTREIDIPAFRSGIFSWGPRILAPVEYTPPSTGFVDLGKAIDQMNSLAGTFFPWCVTGGIGLYSLKKGPAGIMTRYDIKFRNASRDEMLHDLNNFGEQVMGPEVGKGEDEKYKHNPRFPMWETEFYYTGPPRVVVARFATRVFPGNENLPSKERVAEFVREVDGIGLEQGHVPGGEVASQGYRYFYALGGLMYHTGFGKAEEYNPDEMKKLWGSIEVDAQRNTLYFYPQGNRDKGKDFTALLEDIPEDFLN